MCMPLKPATTRDCGGGVQFNAATTGTFITPKAAADRFLSVLQEEDITKKKEKKL